MSGHTRDHEGILSRRSHRFTHRACWGSGPAAYSCFQLSLRSLSTHSGRRSLRRPTVNLFLSVYDSVLQCRPAQSPSTPGHRARALVKGFSKTWEPGLSALHSGSSTSCVRAAIVRSALGAPGSPYTRIRCMNVLSYSHTLTRLPYLRTRLRLQR